MRNTNLLGSCQEDEEADETSEQTLEIVRVNWTEQVKPEDAEIEKKI